MALTNSIVLIFNPICDLNEKKYGKIVQRVRKHVGYDFYGLAKCSTDDCKHVRHLAYMLQCTVL